MDSLEKELRETIKWIEKEQREWAIVKKDLFAENSQNENLQKLDTRLGYDKGNRHVL
jgi:hypothetical protein